MDVAEGRTHVSLVGFNDEAEVMQMLNERNDPQFFKDFVTQSIQRTGSRDAGEIYFFGIIIFYFTYILLGRPDISIAVLQLGPNMSSGGH